MIASSSNSHIKRIQKLMKNARFRRQEQAFIVEGWKMADEALVRGLVKSLYLSERAEGEYTKRQMLPGYGGHHKSPGNSRRSIHAAV